MANQIKINGIRLYKNLVQVTQEDMDSSASSEVPLYRDLSASKINMVFMTLNKTGKKAFVSGTIAEKYFGQMVQGSRKRAYTPKTCSFSIYPHHYRMHLLGFLLERIGRFQLRFLYMTCSNSMLTFVIEEQTCDAFIKMLSENFDLPLSHVPFEQKENNDESLFLKKKYPESRASYMEKKIKTYGITLTQNLKLHSYFFPLNRLLKFGQNILSLIDKEDQFFHTSAYMTSVDGVGFAVLTDQLFYLPPDKLSDAELLCFHGPHFGDRHSIISRALNCLFKNRVQILTADCTGASISIILPKGKGQEAKNALVDVFEVPA